MRHGWLVTAVLVAALVGATVLSRHERGTGSLAPGPAPVTDGLRVVLGERMPSRDLGDLPRGGRREVALVVSNPGPEAVELGPVRVSCGCFAVELDATRVEAGGEVRGRVVIDLSHQPDFAAGLILDAEAAAADGGPSVFVLKLFVQVK